MPFSTIVDTLASVPSALGLPKNWEILPEPDCSEADCGKQPGKLPNGPENSCSLKLNRLAGKIGTGMVPSPKVTVQPVRDVFGRSDATT